MCHSEITTKRKTECRRHGQNIAVGGADRHNPRKQYPTQIEPQSGGGKRSAIELHANPFVQGFLISRAKVGIYIVAGLGSLFQK